MRLVFFGSGAFGLPTLEHLLAHPAHQVIGAVTQPDRPAGRGGKPTPTPIAAYLVSRWDRSPDRSSPPAFPVLKPEKINTREIIEQIRSFNADAFVVIAFGQKLPRALLQNTFAINLHASLLPRWRGAAPINAAILAGDTHTGNSVITLADRMDAGLILAQTRPPLPIDPLVTAGELHDQLALGGPALIGRVLDQSASNALSAREQNPTDVTIAGKLSRNDDNFDPNQPADFIRRQVHALTPWPGISVSFLGPAHHRTDAKLLRVESAHAERAHAAEPGSLIDARAGLIGCAGSTTLRILELQPVGKRPMKYADFINGAGRSLLAATTPPMVASTREISA